MNARKRQFSLTGSIPVASGGTGQATLTANGIVYGQGAAGVGVTAPGVAGQVLAGTAATTRALAVTTNDAVNPFALDIKVTGAATLAERAVILQTTDWNYDDGGNILLQPEGCNVGIGASTATSRLTVAGTIESNSGGVKFPDGATQTKALANCSVDGDTAVMHNGAWVCKSALPRYLDNLDGTVTDNQTGLMWEKKLASSGAACLDAAQANREVRCVQNLYFWTADTAPYTEPTGTMYLDFLRTLNDLNTPADPATICFAGHCDWRIPTIGELRSIVVAYPSCTSDPCIDSVFGPTRGADYYHYSSSSIVEGTSGAWGVGFGYGDVAGIAKSFGGSVRAVRRLP